MRWNQLITVSALFASVCVVQAAESGIQSLDQAWAKAMKANSADAIMECYASDAVAWFPGEAEAKGEKAIRESYVKMFADNEIKDIIFSETVYKNAGHHSLSWGKVAISVVAKATGKPEVWKARFTGIAEKRGERWVYVVDHASAEPAPKK